jgi:hypothetical protein
MTRGIWTNPQSDLNLVVYNVYHIGEKKIKLKAYLVNKHQYDITEILEEE